MPSADGSPLASVAHLLAGALRRAGSSLTTEPAATTPTPSPPVLSAGEHRIGFNDNILEMSQSLINLTFVDNRTNVVLQPDIDSAANNGHNGFTLREEQWVAPVMALSCLNMIVIALFEIFVIFKACR